MRNRKEDDFLPPFSVRHFDNTWIVKGAFPPPSDDSEEKYYLGDSSSVFIDGSSGKVIHVLHGE